MKVQGLERVAINVPDLEEAVGFFSQILGIAFEGHVDLTQPGSKQVRAAISSKGLELLQEIPPHAVTSLRSMHFRVGDLGEAAEQVQRNGGKLLGRFKTGAVEQLISDIMGVRIIFISYPGDDVIRAMEKQ